MRRISIAFAGLAVAALAMAQLSKYKDWAKSPEAYFLTPEERQEWSKVGSDSDAEKFIATYWAKRGGDRFKAEIARRVAAADEQFKMRRQKGSESARGRLLVALGGPSRVTQARAASVSGEATSDTGLGSTAAPGTRPGADTLGGASSQSQNVIQTWIYEKDKLDPAIGELKARIVVDNLRGSDELQNKSDVDRAIAKMAEKSIVNPSATAATGGAVAGGVAPSAPNVPSVGGTGPATAPPPAAVTTSLPAATRGALEPVLKAAKETNPANFWGGPFRAGGGDQFYALQFYFPGDKAPTGAVKFGGIVTSESGGEAASFWEDALLTDMKTGAKPDKVFERSIVLPPGSYRGAFGIFPADGSAPLESAGVSFKLEPKASEFDVSPLILTNELKPQSKRPGLTDPFIFGVEKPIKVEPKANRAFSKEDSLWYFYSVSNPKLPEAGAVATPAPATSPAPGASAPAAEAVRPRIMQKIGVLRDGKPAFAPFTGPAEMQQLNAGYYASGSEIPLATFEPGYYTFTLSIRDLNAPRDSAAFKGLDRQADFIVLKPDGGLPEKAAAKAAPAPTPHPRPKKS